MTQTLPHTHRFEDAGDDRAIRLPGVDLPPAPTLAHRLRFHALVALGYAYVASVLLLFVFAIVALAAAGAIWPLLFVAAALWVVLPALRLKVEPPGGLKLTRANAGPLLDLVDRRRRELRAPRPTVLLVPGAEAYVAEVPRLGVLGWSRAYLVLGLPYLLALTPEELDAVVAHELAHVARRHVGARSGRGALARWRQLDARLEERDHWSGRFFRPFLRRYLPRLERATLAVSRRHEYEADRAAAAVAGADAAASGLLRISLVDRHLDETVWEEVTRRAADERRPPRPYALMRAALREDVAHRRARLVELLRHADSDWTHPTAAQRLRSLGVESVQPSRLAPATVTAAEVHLGESLHDLVAAFDEQWAEDVAEAWAERHDELVASREQLAALGAGDDLETRRQRAALTAALEGAPAARRLFEDVLREDDADARAHYWVGRALLEAGDERGLEQLERAVQLDVHGTLDTAEVAVPFLVDAERSDEVDAWRERADAYAARAAVAHAERQQLRPGDALVPHGLDAEVVQLLADDLGSLSGVRRAYVARKRCEEFDGDDPMWVVAIRRRRRRFRLERQRHTTRLIDAAAERVEPILGGRFWVVVLEDVWAPLEPTLSDIEGARVVGDASRTVRLRRTVGLRGVAIAAVVSVAVLFGALTLLEGEGGAPPLDPETQAFVDPTGSWAARTNGACGRIRVGNEGPQAPRAQLSLERALITTLAAAGAEPGSAAAVRLAQSRLASLERALELERVGRRDAARAELQRHDRAAAGVRRSLAALGVPACAAP